MLLLVSLKPQCTGQLCLYEYGRFSIGLVVCVCVRAHWTLLGDINVMKHQDRT